MSNIAIQVENIGKRYRIGARQEPDRSFRETINDALLAPFRQVRQLLHGQVSRKTESTFWALKDISFEVKQGDVIGVIGRNGAGKSTLLKILSRITDPTEGRVIFRGRLSTLLEVGTGFHPELTGRENIYLNGAILGMRKIEIDRKFDEIVAFSEIEGFIDTPVKHYSSGMYLRLAFAVAAHLEPDILLVDEVLAVGDVAFQRKCIGKMSDVAQAGRTVLFVSHNMSAVQSLCTRSIILESGHLLMDGNTVEVIPAYLRQFQSTDNGDLHHMPRARDEWGKKLKVSHVQLLSKDGEPTTALQLGQAFSIVVDIVLLEDITDVSIIIGFDSILNTNVVTVASEESNRQYSGHKGQTLKIEAFFDNLILNVGQYTLRVGARAHGHALDLVSSINLFEVTDYRSDNYQNLNMLGGVIRYIPKWD